MTTATTNPAGDDGGAAFRAAMADHLDEFARVLGAHPRRWWWGRRCACGGSYPCAERQKVGNLLELLARALDGKAAKDAPPAH